MLKVNLANRVPNFSLKLLIVATTAVTLGTNAYSQTISSPGPMRGLYEWANDQYIAPQTLAPYDSYARFKWSQLETTQGSYNFSAIDAYVNAARAARQKFSFRIEACWAGENSIVPQYLMNEMPNAFWCDMYAASGNDTYVPDWNSPAFLSATANLLNALGAKYNNDPAVGWVDVGIYGDWGEWHVQEFPYAQHPNAAPATQATERAIIDDHVSAFSNKRIIMGGGDQYGFDYAMGLSPNIGFRLDCLGGPWFTGCLGWLPDWATLGVNRWQTAPFVAEFLFPNPSGMMATALSQVEANHVTMVANGNISAGWSGLSAADKQNFETIGAVTGYNFQIWSPITTLTPGQATVDYLFQNVGNAPAYEPWQVSFEVMNSSQVVVGTHLSSLNLETTLPWSVPTPRSNYVTYPTNLPHGTYSFNILITDPSGYRLPMPLRGLTPSPDGSYVITTFQL